MNEKETETVKKALEVLVELKKFRMEDVKRMEAIESEMLLMKQALKDLAVLTVYGDEETLEKEALLAESKGVKYET